MKNKSAIPLPGNRLLAAGAVVAATAFGLHANLSVAGQAADPQLISPFAGPFSGNKQIVPSPPQNPVSSCGAHSQANAPSTYQVVAFGTSLTDAGTYAPKASEVGGGRFTTNPGQVWAQDVANHYNNTLTAAYTGGFGFPLTPQPGGLDYAQGGARVVEVAGVGYAANGSAATTVPIRTQLQNYLSAHGGFKPNQLVLVEGGANDILINAELAATGQESDNDAAIAVSLAAAELAGLVTSMVKDGAQHLVLSNVPDLGRTPEGLASSDQGAALSSLATLFNDTLRDALRLALVVTKAGNNRVVQADAYAFLDNTLASYQAYGFLVGNSGTACNLQELAPFGGSSLFCSPATYTVPGADQTYMFADLIHPTTRLHQLFANYVVAQLTCAGD